MNPFCVTIVGHLTSETRPAYTLNISRDQLRVIQEALSLADRGQVKNRRLTDKLQEDLNLLPESSA